MATKLFSGAAVVAVQDPHRMNEFYSSEASACMANVLTQGKWEETLIRMVRRVTAEPGTGDDPPPPPPELVLELGQCGYDYMRRFVAPQHVYMFMERSLREYGAKLATRPVTEAELLDAGFTKLVTAEDVFRLHDVLHMHEVHKERYMDMWSEHFPNRMRGP